VIQKEGNMRKLLRFHTGSHDIKGKERKQFMLRLLSLFTYDGYGAVALTLAFHGGIFLVFGKNFGVLAVAFAEGIGIVTFWR
jgi:hypothetical protein